MLFFLSKGSLISLIQQVIDDPTQIIQLLATTLPQQSLFFLLYLMVAGMGRQPIGLVRILNLIGWTFGHLLAKNPTQVNRILIY